MATDRHEGNPQSRVWTRRSLLRIGGLGAAGLNLADLARAESAARARAGKPAVDSCIFLFYYGGPSHLDTYDMKPRAPTGIRGDFKAVASSAPGVFVSEQQPHMARVMYRAAVIRSLHHPMTNHNAAVFATFIGRNPLKGDLELLGADRNDPPTQGAILSAGLPETPGVPGFVALPHVIYNVVTLPGQNGGFLGSAYDPLQVDRDPNLPDFRFSELELPADLSVERLDSRRSLLDVVDHQLREGDRLAARSGIDAYNARAFGLLRSPKVRRAFELDREGPKVRERYGRTKHGQSVLLARRLVESGVRFVTVFDHQHNGEDNWDTHNGNFRKLKDNLLPPTDRALAALIEDLADRGMLERTLVIAVGEFGRSPKINSTAGRDHWPHCYSAVLAGGGVQGGMTYGSSDRIGAYPDQDAVTPGDLSATLLWRFGLDHTALVHDLTGRPYRLAEGEPIAGLFGGRTQRDA